MRRALTWGLVILTVIGGAARYGGYVQATPASGFTGNTIAKGRFDESFQKVKGPSDIYVQSNVLAPGGTTGWHSHPGDSLIIVTAGTVTTYEGADPSCTPHKYTPGMGFVDRGGDHVHVLRNESMAEARTVAVQLLPTGADRRIDAEGNSACRF